MQARLIQGAVSALALPVMLWRFSPEQQGYFLGFLNLAAAIPAFDLGLTLAIVPIASHYRALGEAATLARFWNRACRLAVVLLAVLALVIGTGGWAAFSRAGADRMWLAAWVACLLASVLAHAIAVPIAYVEGAVSPVVAWRLQRRLEAISGVLFLVALAAGAGPWSLAVPPLMRSLVALPFLRRQNLPGWGQPASLGWWRQHVWAFQWRVGVGTASQYLARTSFTPMILILQGPASASRFGLSWAIMNMALTISTAWPASQSARFSRLASEGDLAELRRRFRVTLALSTALLALGSAVIVGSIGALGILAPALAARFAGPGIVGMLMAAAIAQHVVACFVPYLRAGRSDPFLKLMVFGSTATFIACGIAARYGDIGSVAAAYLVCSLAGLPYCVWRWRAMR